MAVLSRHPGSSSLLVIQGHCSIIATSEARVTHSKILTNQWRNRASSRDQLCHQLALTKNDDEPTSFTPVGNETDRARCRESFGRAFHQRHGLSCSGLHMSAVRPHFRACVTSPAASQTSRRRWRTEPARGGSPAGLTTSRGYLRRFPSAGTGRRPIPTTSRRTRQYSSPPTA